MTLVDEAALRTAEEFSSAGDAAGVEVGFSPDSG